MLRRIVGHFVIALILVFPNLALSQPKTPPAPNGVQVEASVTKNAEKAQEVAVLKAKLEVMRDFNQHILATVYWSLGTVGAVALLLVGFGWFTTHKLHERELAALKQELANDIDLKFVAFNETATKETAVKIEEKTKLAEQRLTSALERRMTTIDLTIRDNSQRIVDLTFASLKSEAQYWELKDVKANQLTAWMSILLLGIESKNDAEITNSLEAIRRLLEDGTRIFRHVLTSLTDAVDKLPSRYAIATNAIREALKKAEVY